MQCNRPSVTVPWYCAGDEASGFSKRNLITLFPQLVCETVANLGGQAARR